MSHQEYIELLKEKSFQDLTESDIWSLKKLGALNGCGGKGCIIRPPAYIFFEADCDYHDFGYWTKKKPRYICDIKFFQAMIRDCDRALESFMITEKKYYCYFILSILYFVAVRTFGWYYWYKY